MTKASFAIANVNASSDTTNIQSDIWFKAFLRYLDENPDTREILLRWKKSRCNLSAIVRAIYRYVVDGSSERRARLKERMRTAKNIFPAAILSFSLLEAFYRVSYMEEAADHLADEARVAKETWSRIKSRLKAKRLGVSRSWADLAIIEGFVVEAIQQPPTPKELVSLIRAGRAAAGQKADFWETNPANIRKGQKTFKKNNPHQASLWSRPSRRL